MDGGTAGQRNKIDGSALSERGCISLKHKLKPSNLQTYKTMKLSASVYSLVLPYNPHTLRIELTEQKVWGKTFNSVKL